MTSRNRKTDPSPTGDTRTGPTTSGASAAGPGRTGGARAMDGHAGRTPGETRDDMPQDADGLRADIEHTRHELGETIEELTHRMDVPARLHRSVEEATGTASAKVTEVRDRVVEAGHTAGRQITAHTPEPVRHAAGDTFDRVRRNPAPTAGAVGGVAVAVVLTVWLVRRSRR